MSGGNLRSRIVVFRDAIETARPAPLSSAAALPSSSRYPTSLLALTRARHQSGRRAPAAARAVVVIVPRPLVVADGRQPNRRDVQPLEGQRRASSAASNPLQHSVESTILYLPAAAYSTTLPEKCGLPCRGGTAHAGGPPPCRAAACRDRGWAAAAAPPPPRACCQRAVRSVPCRRKPGGLHRPLTSAILCDAARLRHHRRRVVVVGLPRLAPRPRRPTRRRRRRRPGSWPCSRHAAGFVFTTRCPLGLRYPLRLPSSPRPRGQLALRPGSPATAHPSTLEPDDVTPPPPPRRRRRRRRGAVVRRAAPAAAAPRRRRPSATAARGARRCTSVGHRGADRDGFLSRPQQPGRAPGPLRDERSGWARRRRRRR